MANAIQRSMLRNRLPLPSYVIWHRDCVFTNMPCCRSRSVLKLCCHCNSAAFHACSCRFLFAQAQQQMQGRNEANVKRQQQPQHESRSCPIARSCCIRWWNAWGSSRPSKSRGGGFSDRPVPQFEVQPKAVYDRLMRATFSPSFTTLVGSCLQHPPLSQHPQKQGHGSSDVEPYCMIAAMPASSMTG